MTKKPPNRNKRQSARPVKRQSQQSQSHMVLQQVHHEGPLPAPSDFEHYERIYPGAAEMILDMATQESVHRRYMETKAMSRAHREAGRFGYRLCQRPKDEQVSSQRQSPQL